MSSHENLSQSGEESGKVPKKVRRFDGLKNLFKNEPVKSTEAYRLEMNKEYEEIVARNIKGQEIADAAKEKPLYVDHRQAINDADKETAAAHAEVKDILDASREVSELRKASDAVEAEFKEQQRLAKKAQQDTERSIEAESRYKQELQDLADHVSTGERDQEDLQDEAPDVVEELTDADLDWLSGQDSPLFGKLPEDVTGISGEDKKDGPSPEISSPDSPKIVDKEKGPSLLGKLGDGVTGISGKDKKDGPSPEPPESPETPPPTPSHRGPKPKI